MHRWGDLRGRGTHWKLAPTLLLISCVSTQAAGQDTTKSSPIGESLPSSAVTALADCVEERSVDRGRLKECEDLAAWGSFPIPYSIRNAPNRYDLRVTFEGLGPPQPFTCDLSSSKRQFNPLQHAVVQCGPGPRMVLYVPIEDGNPLFEAVRPPPPPKQVSWEGFIPYCPQPAFSGRLEGLAVEGSADVPFAFWTGKARFPRKLYGGAPPNCTDVSSK